MAALWYCARATLRQRVVGTVLLALFVGLGAGFILAAVAGAARARDALPRFVAYNQAYEAAVFVSSALPPPEQERILDDIEARPEWDGLVRGAAAVVSVRLPSGDFTGTVATAVHRGREFHDLDRPIIVDGRLAEAGAAEEATVNEAFAEDMDVGVSDTFELRTITPERLEDAGNGEIQVDPEGETVEMTVAGIVRQPADLRSGAQDEGGTVFATDAWELTLTPAFSARYGDRMANYGLAVLGNVDDEPGAEDRLGAAVSDISQENAFFEAGNEDTEVLASVRQAIDFEANALIVFAAVLALAALLLVGQTIGRTVTLDLTDDGVLRAEGLGRGTRLAVPLVRAALVGLGGALIAVALALALSSQTPLGLARRAELDPGVHVDLPVLAIGALVIILVVVGRAAFTSWRLTRPGRDATAGRARPRAVASRLARAGAPVTAVSGVRMALERGTGSAAVPVTSALLATVAGVVGVVGILVFSNSLERMTSTPVLQGWTWDVAVGNYSRAETVEAGAETLDSVDEVDSYVGVGAQPLTVEGQELVVVGIGPGDATAGPPVLDGRAPAEPDEIVVGIETLDALDKELGNRVEIAAQPGIEGTPATIVGTFTPPAGMITNVTLGEGVGMTLEGLQTVYGPDSADVVVPQFHLVRFDAEVSRDDGVEALSEVFGDTIVLPRRPTDVEDLRRVQSLPVVLAVVVGFLAVGTLMNTLVTSVRRRRRDLATLASLGLQRRQVGSTVAWQATTYAAVGLGVGIPLGLAAGRLVWRSMMTALGTEVAPAVPILALVAVAAGVLVLANLAAAVPARAATRIHPAEALRAE